MSAFHFSHDTKGVREKFQERFFQVLPGLMSWTVLITLTALSFLKPLYAAMMIIAFEIYWLFRLLYMALFLLLAYGVLVIERDANWIKRCRHLESGEESLAALRRKLLRVRPIQKFRPWLSLKNQERELARVLKDRIPIPPFDSIYHVVIIAAAKEGREVIEPGLEALAKSQFPAKRILPVLAIEARSGPAHRKIAESLEEKYRRHFSDFLVSVHPDGVSGEAKVKGANVSHAAREAARYLEGKNIPFENVLVSCFDADTVPSPQYFSSLTYHFMRHPNRTRASFQPIPVYNNNFWEASAFARVLEMGSSFFQLVEATNPEKLVTFSSHSMSFKALVEIGYWPVDMISDDSAIFWKALVHYDGDYHVIPMYVTLSMDVVTADSTLKTLANIYRQKRRWAWGVENFPVVMRAFIKNKKMKLRSKLRYALKLLEMHVSWATLGFILTFIGWLPAIFASREFSSSVLYYNSSRITALIFNLASTTFFVTIPLSLFLLPKGRTAHPLLKRLLFSFEWLLMPLIFTFFSTLPALDAQTHLMRGHLMEFWVTEKGRKKKGGSR